MRTFYRIVFTVSIAMNLLVVALFALWYSDRARPDDVGSAQMQRMIQERSWNSAGEWWVVALDADAIIIEYRLPVLDFHRYRLRSNAFRLSSEARARPVPFKLQYEGCEVLRFVRERNAFVCMPFRDLRGARAPLATVIIGEPLVHAHERS